MVCNLLEHSVYTIDAHIISYIYMLGEMLWVKRYAGKPTVHIGASEQVRKSQ